MLTVARWQGSAGRIAGILLAVLSLGGCATLINSVASDLANSLTQAILNQDDPATVRDGAPAYLLMVDSFIQGQAEDPALLGAGAQLYTFYAALFADEPPRAKVMTRRALDYGQRALCAQARNTCSQAATFEEFEAQMASLDEKDVPALYSMSLAWLAWLNARSDDWGSVAALPRAELALNRVQALDPHYNAADVHFYLGVINTLRPPALGGQPERGREHFEQAIELSQNNNLSVKVEYARRYARLLYDRELHDRLLNEVLESDPVAPGFTLQNTLAQQEAASLLQSADEYF